MGKSPRYEADIATTEDEFDFATYGDALLSLVSHTETPATIGIFGPWGSGKTSLMKMLQERIDAAVAGTTTVWFDAWKFGTEQAIWRALFLDIIETLRSNRSYDDALCEQMDQLQARLYSNIDKLEEGSLEFHPGSMAKGTLKLGLSFLPQFIGADDIPRALGSRKLSRFLSPPKSALGDFMEVFSKQQTRIRRARVQFVEEFQRTFEAIVEAAVDERLVVFVDDLDRTLPQKSIEVLEAMKMFLAARKCVFVVGVEQAHIARGVRAIYESAGLTGSPNENEYIEKIIQLPFHLPPLHHTVSEEFVSRRLDSSTVARILAVGALGNPRKLKRIANQFNLLWDIAERRGLCALHKLSAELLAKLVVIQHRWPSSLFEDICRYPHLPSALERQYYEAAGSVFTAESEQSGTKLPSDTLVSKYSALPGLEDIMMLGNTAPFARTNLQPYIFLASLQTTEAPDAAGGTPTTRRRIWSHLLCGDEVLVEQASMEARRRGLDQKGSELVSQLERITRLEAEAFEVRASALLALAHLGDIRLKFDRPDMLPEVLTGSASVQIARYPVTNGEYNAYLSERSGRHARGRATDPSLDNHPATHVSQRQAQAYADWLQGKTSRPYRLPTSQEWSAAAGGADRDYPWPTGAKLKMRCNTREAGIGKTTPVGLFLDGVTPEGIFDLAGNIWEWCGDPAMDSDGLSGENWYILGGSWRSSISEAKNKPETAIHYDEALDDVGFRLALDSRSS